MRMSQSDCLSGLPISTGGVTNRCSLNHKDGDTPGKHRLHTPFTHVSLLPSKFKAVHKSSACKFAQVCLCQEGAHSEVQGQQARLPWVGLWGLGICWLQALVSTFYCELNLFFFCICVCMCAHVCVEARGWPRVSSLPDFHFAY